MKEEIVKYICDICGETSTSKMLEISVDSKYLDRHWVDYHICDRCVSLIVKANAIKKV